MDYEAGKLLHSWIYFTINLEENNVNANNVYDYN